MKPILAVVLCLLAVLVLALNLRNIRRAQQLEDKLDSICGLTGEEGLERSRTLAGTAADVLAIHNLSPQTVQGRSVLILAAIGSTALIVFAGWKFGIAAAFFGLIGRFSLNRMRRNKRAQEFADGLPALLERVRRLVLIGNTLPQAFVEAVATAEPVVKREIDPVVRRIRHGAPFPDSIEMLARQMDIIELHMLAAYVRTNAKFGGRVAQTLVNLINQLGNKRRLEREIRAATAETRASAIILFGLMTLTMVAMSVLNPEYLRFFLDTDLGRVLLVLIVGWPLLGALIMRWILVLDF